MLEKLINESYSSLTKEQRSSLRTILCLCAEANIAASDMYTNAMEEKGKIKSKDIKYTMSIYTAIYKLSYDISQHKEMYVLPDDYPMEDLLNNPNAFDSQTILTYARKHYNEKHQ